MKINTITYFISDAFKSLKRNKTISFASIATVLTTLLVFGAFLLVGLNVKEGVLALKSKVEIKVNIKDDATDADKSAIEEKLKSISGVKGVEFEDKATAMKNFKEMFKGNETIIEGYNNEKDNPLAESYLVKLETPEVASSVEKNLKTDDGKLMPGIEDIGNDQELIDTINSFVKTVNWVGLGLFIILTGVSLFLIMNTIKITVYSRRREIGIMKFVGATDWFIRWPFVIEGIVIGLVGAVLCDAILYGVYNFIFTRIGSSWNSMRFIDPSYILTTMSWQFILAGVLIGVFGSIIALRKFLDV